MLLPPPLIVPLDAVPGAGWTSYVTPAATWKTTDLPVAIAFGSKPPSSILDADAVAALDVATRAWMLPSCTLVSFRIDASTSSAIDVVANGKNEILVHTSDWPSPLAFGALAHTVIYTSGDRIVEADIHVNAKEWTFTLGATSGNFDLRSVLTHELGHVIGIGHSADSRATMAAGLPAGIAARSLEDDDLAAVCALYPATTASAKGCDVGAPCPSGYACVGHACERPGEPAVLGAACDPASSARRCEGAGDRARCITTTIGERCATTCAKVDTASACGTGLVCVPIVSDDDACLPIGADPPRPDAGPADATPDARPPTPDSNGDSGSCSIRRARENARERGGAGAFVLLLVTALLMRRHPLR